MGRKPNPLYKDPNSGIYYYRYYIGKKRSMLSLATNDPLEAMQRLPIAQTTKTSWPEYQKFFDIMPPRQKSTISGFGSTKFSPPIQIETTKDGITDLIEEGIRLGNATYDPSTGAWTVTHFGEPEEVIEGLNYIKKKLSNVNNSKDIENFYRQTIPQLFIDKKAAKRNADIWLSFLQERKVTSWKQINEILLADFKTWRKNTIIYGNNQKKGVRPSALVVNRHLRYLSKSFEEARDREYIRFNPIKNWKPEPHTPPLQNSLTPTELKKLLSDLRWQQNYLTNGRIKLPLGYKLLDIALLLFVSCKRRKEILKLRIEDINYSSNFAYYKETKNSSKGTVYVIHKAFWLTPDMKRFLKRIISDRTEGLVFPSPECLKRGENSGDLFNADYLSEVFKEISDKVAPKKGVTLNNLRHTATDILEKAGLTDMEIDATLGHISVKTALPNYLDRSSGAIAKRLSKKTRKGVEILCKTVKDFF